MWADVVGDDNYPWRKFLPRYEKSVNFTEPDMNLRMANSTPAYNAMDVSNFNGQAHVSVTWSHYAQAFGTWVSGAESSLVNLT
jgi:choline dehydrogenase